MGTDLYFAAEQSSDDGRFAFLSGGPCVRGLSLHLTLMVSKPTLALKDFITDPQTKEHLAEGVRGGWFSIDEIYGLLQQIQQTLPGVAKVVEWLEWVGMTYAHGPSIRIWYAFYPVEI